MNATIIEVIFVGKNEGFVINMWKVESFPKFLLAYEGKNFQFRSIVGPIKANRAASISSRSRKRGADLDGASRVFCRRGEQSRHFPEIES